MKPPQASPSCLNISLPNKCSGKPTSLTHKSFAETPSLKQSASSLYQSIGNLFPSNLLILEFHTLLAHKSSQTQKKMKGLPIKDKWRFPFSLQLYLAQIFRGSKSYVKPKKSPHLPIILLSKSTVNIVI